MPITIKAANGGYYVDQPIQVPTPSGLPVYEDDPEARKKRLLYLQSTLEGFDPFESHHAFALVTDINGVRYRVHTLANNQIINIRRYSLKEEPREVEITLTETNGFWHFVVGKELEG